MHALPIAGLAAVLLSVSSVITAAGTTAGPVDIQMAGEILAAPVHLAQMNNDTDEDATPDTDTTEGPGNAGDDVDNSTSGDGDVDSSTADDGVDSSTSGDGDVDTSGTND